MLHIKKVNFVAVAFLGCIKTHRIVKRTIGFFYSVSIIKFECFDQF